MPLPAADAFWSDRPQTSHGVQTLAGRLGAVLKLGKWQLPLKPGDVVLKLTLYKVRFPNKFFIARDNQPGVTPGPVHYGPVISPLPQVCPVKLWCQIMTAAHDISRVTLTMDNPYPRIAKNRPDLISVAGVLCKTPAVPIAR